MNACLGPCHLVPRPVSDSFQDVEAKSKAARTPTELVKLSLNNSKEWLGNHRK